MSQNKKLIAVIFALLAAIFYAINTPVSKVLLDNVGPTYMAAFLYLGAGIGVGIMYMFRFRNESNEERLGIKDLPYTLGMIVLDVAAPIFLMLGIKNGSASNASLLGNFEIVATTLIALLIFGEKITAKLWCGISFIFASSIFLSLEGAERFQFSLGSVFVFLATCCWGLENNCTRKISDKSTHEIVLLKGIFSGCGALIVAMIVGEKMPEIRFIIFAMLLGFIAYGLSIFLYIKAQRELGAAKTSAYYAIAPFIGAFIAFAVNGEKPEPIYFVGLALMIVGTIFVVYDTLTKQHTHEHRHVIVHSHNGVSHLHVIEHSHEHSHFVLEEKHKHYHEDYVNDEEHMLEHRGRV